MNYKGMGNWIKDKVKGFFGGIVDGVKGLLGIHSPSTVFADIGKFSMKGLAQGIDKNKAEAAKAAGDAVKAAGDAAENALPALNPGFETSVKVNTAGLYAQMKGAVDAETSSYSRNAANLGSDAVPVDNSTKGGGTVTHKVEVGFAPDGSKLARDLNPYIKRQTEIEGDSFVKEAIR